MSAYIPQLNPAQLELLQLFAGDFTDEQINEIKKRLHRLLWPMQPHSHHYRKFLFKQAQDAAFVEVLFLNFGIF